MKRFRFSILPCVVMAIVAILLAIGFMMPFAAEASWGGGPTIVEPGTGPGISAGVLDTTMRPILPQPEAKIVLKDEIPFGLPRPEPWNDLGKAKVAGVKEGRPQVYQRVAGVKWGGGVLSPKPPKADDEFVGFPPKPKAKIVLLGGGGIGRDY